MRDETSTRRQSHARGSALATASNLQGLLVEVRERGGGVFNLVQADKTGGLGDAVREHRMSRHGSPTDGGKRKHTAQQRAKHQ